MFKLWFETKDPGCRGPVSIRYAVSFTIAIRDQNRADEPPESKGGKP